MGKKKQANNLGKSIIRDRFGKKGRPHGDSLLHTSELDDGYEWSRMNLRSVTEESSLDDFLAKAEMAGTEFTAEKLNIKFVSEESRGELLSPEDEIMIKQAQEDHRELLRIPRRPGWDKDTTPQQLDEMERNNFLEWRRKLANLQDVEGITMTPFEKNLEFWRQLWRVIERSDLVVQIVDGRNPLLFRSEDLEMYVNEVDPTKFNMLLINKADYMSQVQREIWAEYFDNVGLKVAFWSAVDETERLKAESKMEVGSSDEAAVSSSTDEDEWVSSIDEDKDDDNVKSDGEIEENLAEVQEGSKEENKCHTSGNEGTGEGNDDQIVGEPSASCVPLDFGKSMSLSHPGDDSLCTVATSDITPGVEKLNIVENSAKTPAVVCDRLSDSASPKGVHFSEDPQIIAEQTQQNTDSVSGRSTTGLRVHIKNDPSMLNGLELLDLFQSLHTGKKYTDGVTTVGLVGYPNVGKSSSINALLQTKKVPVSATPGRTKHFQTLFVEDSLMLCDCPGLVMPSFVSTKAEMVTNGILPIDQMRDYVPPVAQVCNLIPREVLEGTYGIMIPKPREGEDPERPPTAHELLSSYGYMRGFMTHKGIPDFQRSARHVLKDYVTGKLLYCAPPPGIDIERFCPTPAVSKPTKERAHPQRLAVGTRGKVGPVYSNEIDRNFFEKTVPVAGTKGVQGVVGFTRKEGLVGHHAAGSESGSTAGSQQSLKDKPWKKHNNRGKKEKLRRLHSHLDA